MHLPQAVKRLVDLAGAPLQFLAQVSLDEHQRPVTTVEPVGLHELGILDVTPVSGADSSGIPRDFLEARTPGNEKRQH
jgi:hypothetical protein